MPLQDIDPLDVEQFILELQSELAPSTVRQIKTRFGTLLKVAVSLKWLTHSPMPEKIGGLNPLSGVREKTPFTREQFQRLVSSGMDELHRTLVYVACYGGLRVGEIMALQPGDIDEASNVLRVRRAEYRGVVSKPKHGKARNVPMGPVLKAQLVKWRDSLEEGSEWLFPGVTRQSAMREIKKREKELGLPLASWHDMRYTYATWAREAGVKPEALKQMLGHSDITTTLRLYSQVEATAADAQAIEGD